MKFRSANIGVNDVGSMALHSMSELVPNYYIVCLGNSFLFSRYSESFLNFTVNFQINDARLLPIIIPTYSQLAHFDAIFKEVLTIRKLQNSYTISYKVGEKKMSMIQVKNNESVCDLYQI